MFGGVFYFIIQVVYSFFMLHFFFVVACFFFAFLFHFPLLDMLVHKYLLVNSNDFNKSNNFFLSFIFVSAGFGNGYCCDKCGKNYSYSGSLKRHQKYECGKEPQFQCPYCSHKAKHRSNLKSHMIYMHCIS